MSTYRKRYAYQRHLGVPTSLIDAAPSREHLANLERIGWSLHAIKPIVGLSDQGLRLIANGTHAAIERRSAAAIAQMPYSLDVPPRIEDQSFVPAEGAIRRVRALLAMGWTRDHIAARMHRTNPAHLARGTYPQVKAYRWREVATVYDELHMQAGPSDLNRSRSVSYGYVPPLGYDDIDNPDETPRGSRRQGGWDGIDHAVIERLIAGDTVPATRAEKVEAMRRWLAAGRSERSLCVLHGWKDGRYVTREEVAS